MAGMKENFCCAYCGETEASAFNREHVIPRAFGAFYDESGAEVVLKGRVCSKCNGSFKQFEQRHTRESFDVFFRNKFLVKGRKPNETKPNPYKKRSDGSQPVIVRGQPPGTSHDVFLQMDSHVGLSEPTAAHFIHPKTDEKSWFKSSKMPAMRKEWTLICTVAPVMRTGSRNSLKGRT
jgi:hypothetical protein